MFQEKSDKEAIRSDKSKNEKESITEGNHGSECEHIGLTTPRDDNLPAVQSYTVELTRVTRHAMHSMELVPNSGGKWQRYFH
jgi:hypothetical protein